MIGHLGTRVSALLDGRLDAAETERAWTHVHECHACRDLVEREGALKRRLSCLGGAAHAPEHLKASLLIGAYAAPEPVAPSVSHARRAVGIATVGGSAVGAAVLGVLVLGVAPADAPSMDRRAPTTQLGPPSPASVGGFTPASARGRDDRR